MASKNTLFHDEYAPFSLFTHPSDASPIVFTMNEGPEYYRLQGMIEKGGGLLEKASKFDETHKRIRIHDKKMINLEKDVDNFDMTYILDCVKENNLRNDLCNYRLGVSLFEEYDPYDILIGEKTWIDLKKRKNIEEEYMELDNFDKALLTPSANSKNRKSNSYDGQVHILKYIITHGKYNSLKDINTWRRMKVGEVCSGLRTAISLKEHFRKQILPHINIKTYPQFSEEDLNKILRGWKGSKTSFNVEVLERSSRLKQNVPCSDDAAMHKQANVKIENSVGPLQKSSRKLINKDKTHFDESFGIINKKEEVTAMPSYKRIKICNLNILEASSTPIQKYFVKESQDRNTLWLSQTDALKSKEHEAFSKTCMLQSLNYSSQTKFLATWNLRQKDGSKEPEKKERSSDSYSLSKCNNSWYTNDPSNKKGGNSRNGGNTVPPKSLTKNESKLLKSFPNSPNLMINNVKYSSLVNFLEHNGRMNKVQNESEGRSQIFIMKH